MIQVRGRIWTVLFCVASVLALWAAANSRPVSPYTVDTPYEYPILPGTQEWLDLGNTVNRRRACQIPEEMLYHMTTDALLETVLNYPFRSDMYAFNDLQTGYEAVRRRFNGLQEFESRSDCLDALSRYIQADYSEDDTERAWKNRIAETLYFAIPEFAASSHPQPAAG